VGATPALSSMRCAQRIDDMSGPYPKVSIVLPCFNEASRIASSLATLDAWFSGAEVVVVDDGSGDDTLRIAQAYASNRANIVVHRLAVHSGKGAAVRTGISLAHGESIVLMDADLAYDRGSVERVLKGLATADMVVGNRRHHDSHYSVPVRLFGFLYRRHLVGLAFNVFVRMLLQIGLRDTQCGLKGFRRESLARMAPALSVGGFALDVEMLLVARALGLRLVDVPVQVTYESAKSSVKLLHSTFAMSYAILRIAFRRATGRYAPAVVRASAARLEQSIESRRPEESVR
jgi:dolichyl-phosphate beta-glucosyltransferase